ncbi:hypothetical protein [Synechococcus sp. GEYO]|uniref:hypothetical protein n=1 Tax=Synechococcus sp. GEYO TaxID=2575511 RepID=UPI000E0E753B|nr:hypothetical protein [Synechococcus sp. GEYO]
MDTKLICTRSFQKLNETAHYKFCKTFFESGEKEALKIEEYCPVDLKSHKDLFMNLPKDLELEPIWWLMPWGGTVRKPDFNKERRIEIKKHYTARFLDLLKSVERNGFVVSEKFRPPVHQLIKNKQTAFILQDGHHRSAIFNFIVDHDHQNLLKFTNVEQCGKIKVQNSMIIRYQFLPHLKYVKIGGNDGHFSLTDTIKWFDLAFEVLGLSTEETEKTLDYRLSLLQDKLYRKARLI